MKAEIKYELASNGQEYPHVYGAINIDAIIDVDPFPKEKGIYITRVSILKGRKS